MSMILDFMLAAILVACVVVGCRRGLIKSLMGLVSVIAALIIAVNFYSIPAAYINEHFVEPHFKDSAQATFDSLMNGGTETIPPEQIFEDKPDALTQTAERFGVDVGQIEAYYNSIKDTLGTAIDTEAISEKLSEFVVSSVSSTISNIVGFVGLFLAALIIVNLILLLLGLLFKLPVLKFANKFFGGILGALKGSLISVLLANVLYRIVYAFGTDANMFFNKATIDASAIVGYLNSVGLIFK